MNRTSRVLAIRRIADPSRQRLRRRSRHQASGGFTAAYKELVPACEAKIGQKVVSAYGASMGAAPDAIPQRLARKEPADIVILAGDAFDKLVAEGKGMAGTATDLARSAIGLSVKRRCARSPISRPSRR